MEGKTLARIGAAAFAAIAIAAAAIEMTRDEKLVVPVTVEMSTAPADPMREALARCRFMGEAATSDAGCLRTWAENRRRFLGAGTRPTERLPETSITKDAIGKESVPVPMPSAGAR